MIRHDWKMTSNPDDYELSYIYAPGRFERRQHCFALVGKVGTGAEGVGFWGYGGSKQAAMRDLKDEIIHSQEFSAVGFLLPEICYRWRQSQGKP